MCSRTLASSSNSLTASTTKPLSRSLSYMACMAGISVVQGLHQVAQKFTSTILPRYWLKLCDLPSRSDRRKSSACVPTAGTRAPILQASNGKAPSTATNIPIIRTCKRFIATSSWQRALVLRRGHDLKQLRDAEDIAHSLSQISIEITGDRDLR